MSLVMDRRTMRPILSGTTDLLSQIQTPTLAWGDIKTGATPWYSDAGTTPAVPTDGVYRLTEHISGSQYFEQTTAAARPTLTDGTPYDYLSCDGGDRMATPSNLGATGDISFEMVGVAYPTSDNIMLWSIGVDAGVAGAINFGLGNTNWEVVINGLAASSYGAYTLNALQVFRVVKAAGAKPRLFVNGTEKSESGGSAGAMSIGASPLRLCESQHGAGIRVWQGRVSCLLYYSAPLASDALRAADDATIKTYFGIA